MPRCSTPTPATLGRRTLSPLTPVHAHAYACHACRTLSTKMKPRRLGELLVKVEEAQQSESRRSRWQGVGQRVHTAKALSRPTTALQNMTEAMWSDSGEIPAPAQESAVIFDRAHHQLTRRAHLALKGCADGSVSRSSDVKFATHVGELFRMRYAMRAPLLPNAAAYPDAVWGVSPHQLDVDRPCSPPPMRRKLEDAHDERAASTWGTSTTSERCRRQRGRLTQSSGLWEVERAAAASQPEPCQLRPPAEKGDADQRASGQLSHYESFQLEQYGLAPVAPAHPERSHNSLSSIVSPVVPALPTSRTDNFRPDNMSREERRAGLGSYLSRGSPDGHSRPRNATGLEFGSSRACSTRPRLPAAYSPERAVVEEGKAHMLLHDSHFALATFGSSMPDGGA